MTKLLQLINIVLIVINGLVFFMPKKPVSGMHTNAAGGLMLFALALIVILLLHLILFIVAYLYGKTLLLKILTGIMIPLSLLFWYVIGPTVRI